MRQQPRLSCAVLVQVALGMAALGARSSALQLPDVADTTWLLKGSAKLSSPQLGKESVKGYLLTFLSGDGGVGLTDEAGYSVHGAWQFDAEDQLQIVVTEDDVEDFLEDNLPSSVPVEDIDIVSASSKTKLTVKDGVGTLAFKLKFKLTFVVEEESYTLKYSLSVRGKHDVTGVPYAGSEWNLACDLAAKAGKIKLEDSEDLELVLGPAGGLPDDRFVIQRAADDQELYGGYYVLAAGKLAMLPDADAVETYFTDWITPYIDGSYPGAEMSIWQVQPKFSGKIKEDALELRCKAKLPGEFETEDPETFETTEKSFKGSHTLVGEGTPL